MSGKEFSNADTGSKPADPYKEKNYEEVSVKQKVEDLVAFIEKCQFSMMTTRQAQTGLLVSRCMALAGKEHGLDLLFFTNTESGKTDELHNDPKINISFINSSGEWASISGEASIITDREMVKKNYTPTLKAWIGDLGDGKHDGGPEDPRVGIIRVNSVTATYAISHRTFIGRNIEIAKGTITGNAPDVNRLREISKDELASYKKMAGSKSEL